MAICIETDRLFRGEKKLNENELTEIGGLYFCSYLPKDFLTNKDLESWDIKTPSKRTLTAADFLEKTGVKVRYVAGEEDTVQEMGYKASKPIIDATGKEIDAILYSTTYAQGIDLAKDLADRLGIDAKITVNFHLACSGTAAIFSFLQEHPEIQSALIVASENTQKFLRDLRGEEGDPSLSPSIFSQGAYAVRVEPGKNFTILRSKFHQFPKDGEKCICLPFDPSLVRGNSVVADMPASPDGKFWMNGMRVLRNVGNLADLMEKTVNEAKEQGLMPKDVFPVINPHQSTLMMLNGIKEKLPPELQKNFILDISEGNFSSASNIKSLYVAMMTGKIKEGDYVLNNGFGAGKPGMISINNLIRLGPSTD